MPTAERTTEPAGPSATSDEELAFPPTIRERHLIHRSGRWCALKSWAVRLAKRRGLGKAKVALARKLAVVLHKMWVTREPYRWQAAMSA